MGKYLFLVFAWFVFGALHSLLAAGTVKQAAMRVMKSSYKYYRLLYSLFAAASLAWVMHCNFSIEASVLWKPWLLQAIVAGILTIAGLAVMLICIRKYFFYLSGVDALLDEKDRPPTVAVLQQDGLHRYVRHPLYSGTLLFVWALFLGYPFPNNLVSCICITVYTLAGLYFEEKKLLVEYGEAYRNYKARVPALIPRLN